MPWMSRVRLAAVLIAAVSAACDGPVGPPDVPAADLVIRLAGVAVDATSVQEGESVQLSAQPVDASGRALASGTTRWFSSAPRVASVSGSGVLTGQSVGEAEVRAETDGVSTTINVSVTAAPQVLQVACSDGSLPVSLALGEVLTTTASAGQVLCLKDEPGAGYLLVHFNGSSVTGSAVQLEIEGSGVEPVTPSASRGIQPQGQGQPALITSAAGDDFHLRLREREIRDLSHLVRPGAAGPAAVSPAFSAAQLTPEIGEVLELNVSTQSCAQPDLRTGRVEAITERTVVVADTKNPENGFTADEYREIGESFDEQVWDPSVQHFGEPSDIDANGRVVIFFTRAVNELTARDAGVLRQGFFFARDLFPAAATSEFGACETSNEAEMFYMLVPDPSGSVNGNVRTKQFVAKLTVGVLMHEMQHLISASRRLRLLGFENFQEEVWLNEGLSHIAEELLFYSLTPFQAGEDLDGARIRGAGAEPEFSGTQEPNIKRFSQYLRSPSTNSLTAQDDLATRGAAWSFLRYAADRLPGDDATLFRSLVDSDLTGLDNLAAQFGETPMNWMQDWSVAIAADDVGLPLAPRFTMQSWDLRDVFRNLLNTSYPLPVAHLRSSGAPLQESLRQGGAAYTLFRTTGPQNAVRTTAGGVSAPASLRLSIVRTH